MSSDIKGKLAGKFVVLDGPDGCGKSTQAKLLAQWVNEQGLETRSFRDPGTTEIGEKVREILLSKEHDSMCTRTELLLYMAARAQLWHECIGPALERGCCVILDRWLSSTCAYQGYAGGFGMDKVIRIAEDSLERAWPDVTVILDIDTEAAKPRMKAELDRMESKGAEYHGKVRQGFLELAKKRCGDVVVIDAARDIEAIASDVQEVVKKLTTV